MTSECRCFKVSSSSIPNQELRPSQTMKLTQTTQWIHRSNFSFRWYQASPAFHFFRDQILRKACDSKKEMFLFLQKTNISLSESQLGVSGATIVSGSCARPSHSWISRLLTSSLSLGVSYFVLSWNPVYVRHTDSSTLDFSLSSQLTVWECLNPKPSTLRRNMSWRGEVLCTNYTNTVWECLNPKP
jgi:hypothetical protein